MNAPSVRRLMKLSDYIVDFLVRRGVRDVFLVTGGGVIHINDSIGANSKLRYFCCHHEQAVTMATEAYARVKNSIGVSVVTTGPGGTNAITGVAGSWMDSVPHLILSGQVFQKQTIGKSGLRQLGVQEVNIVDLVRPITKHAEMVTEPAKIRFHLEQAWHIASAGRPGPVWLDIPADVQMAMIDPDSLAGFTPPQDAARSLCEPGYGDKVAEVSARLSSSRRPVLFVGQGVRLGGAEKIFLEFAQRHGIPFLTARNANDMVASDHPLYMGRPGTYGQRAANLIVQNADLLIAVGTRLSLPQTGYNSKDFGRNARTVMVDIDQAELDKPGLRIDTKIRCDAKTFLTELNGAMAAAGPQVGEWVRQCRSWNERYPVMLPEYKTTKDCVNSYYFVDELSKLLGAEDVIVTDMGVAFQGTHQGFKVKKGQRLFTNCGFAPMGWGLPAAIGACIANGSKRTTCIAGEGGLMMNLQELQTMMHHKLPIKLFVLNNGGYQTIRQTQEYGFQNRTMGADSDSGVSFPDMERVAAAFQIPFLRIGKAADVPGRLAEAVNAGGPIFCEIMMDPDQGQFPKYLARKREDGTSIPTGIEDLYPYLDPEELRSNMIAERESPNQEQRRTK